MTTQPIAVTDLANLLWAQQRNTLPQPETHHGVHPEAPWTPQKEIAILRIFRTPQAKECVELLAAQGVVAGQHDFLALRREGLAVKEEKSGYHRLTGTGLREARYVAWRVAQRLDLHHFRFEQIDHDTHRVLCTCGYAWRRNDKYQRLRMSCETAIKLHIGDPEAWKRQQASPAMDAARERIGEEFGGGDG